MIETEKIIFKPTSIDSLPEIIEMEKNHSIFVGQYDLDRHKKVISSEDEKHFSIFDRSDNSLIGYVILAGSRDSDSIEFRRIVIATKGQGFGREAVTLIKQLCFDDYKAKRIWLDVYADNLHAISLYKKEGFVKEKMIVDKESDRSMWIMSVLPKK